MSKKDYKQGMSDAMEAYEAFGEKQEAATRRVAQEIGQTAKKVDQLGEQIGEVTDYIMDRERAELYRLNTPVDIADLDDAEKRVLLAVLYQLTADEDEVTEEQQNYVRAVQQYLKIYNPQTQIDLETVENIEDISAQKAILQSVLEFYYLGTHPKTYTDDQMDFLDCFQVNRKTRWEISSHIDAIVETVGIKGLSEKYGFVAAQPRSEFATYQDNGRIPLKTADLCIQKMLYDRFDDGRYFLETQDYLVSFNNWSYKKPDESWDKYGFFRIGKQTGKIERIPMDLEKDFPVEYTWNLSYHVQGNTIYCIENEVNREKRGYSQLVAVDVDNMTYQHLPFKFPVANYTAPVRFHISGDASYLVIYAYMRINYRHYYAGPDSKRPLSKVFVMDLTQGNRVFSLEPNMVVRDAFLYDGNIMLLGCKDGRVSIYKYDVKTKTETDMFPNTGIAFCLSLGVFFSSLPNKWTDDYETAYLIKHMCKIREHCYFVIQKIEPHEGSFIFCRLDEDYKVDGKALPKLTRLFSIDFSSWGWGSIMLCDEYALDCSGALKVYDYKTQKTAYPGKAETQTAHILLGDYLYRKNSDSWHRANILEGVDNPQWELVISPEA